MTKYLLPPLAALLAVAIYALGYWRGAQFGWLDLLNQLRKFEARSTRD